MSQPNYLHVLADRITALERVCPKNCGNIQNDTNSNILSHGISSDRHSVSFNKDLIIKSQIVLQEGLPNSLITTNSHRRLITSKLSDIIYGTSDQIDINVINTGQIKISCPQNISQTSIPTFKQIKLMDVPTEDSNIVTKKYMDDMFGGSGKNTSEISSGPLKILNPTGQCLKIGRNENIYVNVDVDNDGTLSIGNSDGELDILSKKISIMSNVDTTNPNEGAVVFYGGVGIIKNLCVGDGILFKTYNGIPSKLDFFECGSIPMAWEGIWSTVIDGLIVYQRIGINVTLTFPYTSRNATIRNDVKTTIETYLPKRLRPVYDLRIDVDIIDNDIVSPGKAIIYGNDGRIIIHKKTYDGFEQFSGVGVSGFHTFVISFLVTPPQI